MEINKETANRLWVKQFGKKVKARDFAGREMDKSAYNSRSSNFGWNVDHIFPESKGGKTNDSNLICCHILTNSEKADKFPCFKANGKAFEIRRRQNHYEIFPHNNQKNNVVNFFDAGQGLEFWNSCGQRNEDKDEEDFFASYVKIRIDNKKYVHTDFADRMEDFLSELFQPDEIVRRDGITNLSGMEAHIFTVINYDVPHQSDTEHLLERCVLLNTYAQHFFERVSHYQTRMACGMMVYPSMTVNARGEMKERILRSYAPNQDNGTMGSNLYIDELILQNTSAKDKGSQRDMLRQRYGSDVKFYAYDRYYPDLAEDLENTSD